MNSIERLKHWREDLERQDKWLKERGVEDFKSDVKEGLQKVEEVDLFTN